MADKDNKEKDTRIKLPSIKKAAKRDRDIARSQSNNKDKWEFFGIIAVILLLLFVLWGGVNQVGFFQTVGNISNHIGKTLYEMFAKDVDVTISDTGIHLKDENSSGGGSIGNSMDKGN